MYIEQAFKFKHEVWRYLLGTLVVFILGWQFIGVIPLGIVSRDCLLKHVVRYIRLR